MVPRILDNCHSDCRTIIVPLVNRQMSIYWIIVTCHRINTSCAKSIWVWREQRSFGKKEFVKKLILSVLGVMSQIWNSCQEFFEGFCFQLSLASNKCLIGMLDPVERGLATKDPRYVDTWHVQMCLCMDIVTYIYGYGYHDMWHIQMCICTFMWIKCVLGAISIL